MIRHQQQRPFAERGQLREHRAKDKFVDPLERLNFVIGAAHVAGLVGRLDMEQEEVATRMEYTEEALRRGLGQYAVLQEAPPQHPVLRPHRIAIGLYDRRDGALTRTRQVLADIDGPRTEIGELVEQFNAMLGDVQKREEK